MQRTISLLLTLALLLSGTAAQAAAEPSLEVTGGESGLTLELTGLDGGFCGVQVTITLESTADAAFEIDDALYQSHPSLYSTYVQEGRQVTVYVVAKSPLNEGEALRLGLLRTAADASDVSGLKLLRLEDLEGQTFPGGTVIPRPDQPDVPGQPGTPNQPNLPPWTGGGSGSRPQEPEKEPVRYRVKFPESLTGGVLQVSPSEAEAGETVTVTTLPAAGWALDTLAAVTESGLTLRLTDLGDGVYTFPMPAAPVTVRGSFAAVRQDAPLLPFLDVSRDMWYYEAVSYVYSGGLMGGVDAGTFDPEGFTTRGQIVTILHRMENTPPAAERSTFADVPDGQWFTAAVDWAAETGVVDGFGDGSFRPEERITREQLAAILCRYAQSKGLAGGAMGDLSVFADWERVSPWAVQNMAWANGCGLITGRTGNRLEPAGNATRAEVATILMRLCENVARIPLPEPEPPAVK